MFIRLLLGSRVAEVLHVVRSIVLSGARVAFCASTPLGSSALFPAFGGPLTGLVTISSGCDIPVISAIPVCRGNDTYGITGIPSTVGGREVVTRAGLTGSTRIVYPGSGREDA